LPDSGTLSPNPWDLSRFGQNGFSAAEHPTYGLVTKVLILSMSYRNLRVAEMAVALRRTTTPGRVSARSSHEVPCSDCGRRLLTDPVSDPPLPTPNSEEAICVLDPGHETCPGHICQSTPSLTLHRYSKAIQPSGSSWRQPNQPGSVALFERGEHQVRLVRVKQEEGRTRLAKTQLDH